MVEVVSAWERIHEWIDENATEFGAYLCPGATNEELAYMESSLGLSLPDEFLELYRIHNGTYERPLFHGCCFYSIDEILIEWQNSRDDLEKYRLNEGCVEDIDNEESVAGGGVGGGGGGEDEGGQGDHEGQSDSQGESRDYSPVNGNRRPGRKVRYKWWDSLWVPFAGSRCGDTINLDLAPARAGTYGQVIVRRRDFGCFLLADSLVQFLRGFADDLERGRYDLR